jgi:Cytochrome P460
MRCMTSPDFSRGVITVRILVVASLVCLSSTLPAQHTQPNEPRFTPDGQLLRPDNYREWIYLSSGLGMTYGSAPNAVSERFDNVFVTPQAYKAFLATGAWPDKTMFVLEVRSSASKGSINKGGHYQEEIVGCEVHLKDEGRFPTKWAFFEFGTSARRAQPLPSESNCQTCHSANGAVDQTFVQFYPTLIPVAKAKGTFKLNSDK